ncbi:5107_t:CDS:2 [Ambispora leptoticha]|uniref:5107_t:CDS:1 n=1 Tax=Ambispora leptoticha TaxID=144679 RepID=A0A9N8ZVY7_9GLOM|nr:5107_t:CDS:2 [Ambispora leptoticha]
MTHSNFAPKVTETPLSDKSVPASEETNTSIISSYSTIATTDYSGPTASSAISTPKPQEGNSDAPTSEILTTFVTPTPKPIASPITTSQSITQASSILDKNSQQKATSAGNTQSNSNSESITAAIKNNSNIPTSTTVTWSSL